MQLVPPPPVPPVSPFFPLVLPTTLSWQAEIMNIKMTATANKNTNLFLKLCFIVFNILWRFIYFSIFKNTVNVDIQFIYSFFLKNSQFLSFLSSFFNFISTYFPFNFFPLISTRYLSFVISRRSYVPESHISTFPAP